MLFGQGKTLNIHCFPVFIPNEYFWKNHMKENEKKADTYMRVMREIMIDNSDHKDGGEFSDIDRFKFIAAVEGKSELKEMWLKSIDAKSITYLNLASIIIFCIFF